MTNPSLLSTDQNPRFRDSIRNAREGLPTYFGSLLLVCVIASPFLPKVDINSVEVASFNVSNYANARTTTHLSLRPLLPLFPIAIVATSILLFALFLPHGGALTRFLHQTGARYLFFYLLRSTSGLIIRFEDRNNIGLLAIRQDDALFPRFFTLITTLLLATFFYGIAERFVFARSGDREFPLLLLLLHLGGLLAVRLHTLRDILLALEIVTLATYVLLAIERHNRFSTYSGVQAFLLGSVPSARLLVGCSFLYLQTGSLALADIDLLLGGAAGIASFSLINSTSTVSGLLGDSLSLTSASSNSLESSNWWQNTAFSSSETAFSFDALFTAVQPVVTLTVRGLFLIFFNLLFKRTAAPFHFWAPSVYGKGPLASVTFLSLYSKAIALFVAVKLLSIVFSAFTPITTPLLISLGVLSVIVGRFGAFTETVRKRFLVYSSRGHVGFRLRGVAISTLSGLSATFHYLAVYLISSLLAWFLLINRGRQFHHISAFASLRSIDPILATVFSLLLLSRSGLPPLGGFFVKLDVFTALLEAGHSFPAYVLFFRTVASFFYYLRVVKVLFFDASIREGRVNTPLTTTPRYDARVWIRRLLLLVLIAYLGLVQPPLLALQNSTLAAIL